MDSIFWQGYLQPLLSDPGRQYIHLHQEVPWEREASLSLMAALRAIFSVVSSSL